MSRSRIGISGKQAWLALALIVLGYEVSVEDEHLLSSVMDEWLVTHPFLSRAAVAVVALHLVNSMPWFADILSRRFWRFLRGRLHGLQMRV